MKEKDTPQADTYVPQEVRDMDESEVRRLVAEFARTDYWHAVANLVRQKDAECIAALASLDPFKEPTQMSRIQGMRTGLYFVEQASSSVAEESAGRDSGDA